jgi:WD40 repeat protein
VAASCAEAAVPRSTASGDKTLSLWDLRSGLCTQTFYGHHNAVNHASFSVRGDTLVSSDADGIVKVWDVRMVGELRHIVTGSQRCANLRSSARCGHE